MTERIVHPSSRPPEPAAPRPIAAASGHWLAWWAAITLLLLLYALYQALVAAPTEATMGIYYRIFYFHVPAGITGFVAFGINALASIFYLVRPLKRADALALAAAEVGVVFLAINLITGPIWAKPIWGVWWVWDARLTLTLVIWIMYVSYLVLRQFTPQSELQPRLAAAYATFLFVAVPVDYMAIRWWRTQHPQPVIFGGPNSGLAPDMAFALLVCLAAFLALMATLMRVRCQQEMLSYRLVQRRRRAALHE